MAPPQKLLSFDNNGNLCEEDLSFYDEDRIPFDPVAPKRILRSFPVSQQRLYVKGEAVTEIFNTVPVTDALTAAMRLLRAMAKYMNSLTPFARSLITDSFCDLFYDYRILWTLATGGRHLTAEVDKLVNAYPLRLAVNMAFKTRGLLLPKCSSDKSGSNYTLTLTAKPYARAFEYVLSGPDVDQLTNVAYARLFLDLHNIDDRETLSSLAPSFIPAFDNLLEVQEPPDIVLDPSFATFAENLSALVQAFDSYLSRGSPQLCFLDLTCLRSILNDAYVNWQRRLYGRQNFRALWAKLSASTSLKSALLSACTIQGVPPPEYRRTASPQGWNSVLFFKVFDHEYEITGFGNSKAAAEVVTTQKLFDTFLD